MIAMVLKRWRREWKERKRQQAQQAKVSGVGWMIMAA